jgi:predicted lactoylglutathione lyase
MITKTPHLSHLTSLGIVIAFAITACTTLALIFTASAAQVAGVQTAQGFMSKGLRFGLKLQDKDGGNYQLVSLHTEEKVNNQSEGG